MLTILQGSALDYHFVVAALLSAPSCPGSFFILQQFNDWYFHF